MKSILLSFCFIFLATFHSSASDFMYKPVNNENPIVFSWDDNAVNVYPNPAVNYFSVSNLSDDIAKIEVFNILGRKMGAFQINSSNYYEISSYPKGMYLVQFVSNNNDILKTIRLNKR